MELTKYGDAHEIHSWSVHSSVLHIVLSPVPLLTFNFRSLSACFRFCGHFSSADMVEFVMIVLSVIALLFLLSQNAVFCTVSILGGDVD